MKNSSTQHLNWITKSWKRYERMVTLYLRENPVFTGRQRKDCGVPTCRITFRSKRQRAFATRILDGND